MSKNLLFKLLLALSLLACALMWLLSVFLEELKDVNIASWSVVIVSGVWGICFVLKGLFAKNVGVFKKMNVIIGCGLLLVCALTLVNIYAIESKVVFPIIAIAASVAIVLCIIAVGGKKWDQGDNQKVGYKNYYQRKAEEEKRKQDKE